MPIKKPILHVYTCIKCHKGYVAYMIYIPNLVPVTCMAIGRTIHTNDHLVLKTLQQLYKYGFSDRPDITITTNNKPAVHLIDHITSWAGHHWAVSKVTTKEYYQRLAIQEHDHPEMKAKRPYAFQTKLPKDFVTNGRLNTCLRINNRLNDFKHLSWQWQATKTPIFKEMRKIALNIYLKPKCLKDDIANTDRTSSKKLTKGHRALLSAFVSRKLKDDFTYTCTRLGLKRRNVLTALATYFVIAHKKD